MSVQFEGGMLYCAKVGSFSLQIGAVRGLPADFQCSKMESALMQKTTSDHREIRKWAENLGGKPAIIYHPIARAEKLGIRIDFPGESHELLLGDMRPATWTEFFRIFEEQQLLLSFDEKPQGNDPTEWYRFEKRAAAVDAGDES